VLIEPQATNEIVNGGLGGAMATQTRTVTAAQRTLSFTGTGTVTLSGVATGSLVGTGAGESNRVKLTFTPTAGSLTLTVTGTVTDAQLELGAVVTSVVPTPSSSQVRSADPIWDLTGAAFTALWGTGSERTIIVEWYDTGAAAYDVFVAHSSGSIAESAGIYVSGGNIKYRARTGGVDQIDLTIGTIAANGRNKCAFRFGSGAFGASRNGAAEVTGTGTIPAPTHGRISGTSLYAGAAQDILTSLDSRPTAITGAALQALSAL
jgi:hypothetical protein